MTPMLRARTGVFHRLLLLALGCLLLPLGQGRVAAEEPLRIAGAAHLADLPTFVAERDGLFRRNGLRVRVRYNDTGAEALGLLRAGEADVSLMTPTPLVLDRLVDPTPGGADDPIILAVLLHSAHFSQLLVPADSDVHRAEQLEGRRIGLQRSTLAEFSWWQFSELHGVDADRVTLVDRAAAELPQALADNVVDAAMLPEPWIAQAARRLGAAPRLLDDRGLYTGKWVLVSSRRLLAESPAQVRALLRAYRDAIDHIERRPGETMAEFSRYLGAPQDPQSPQHLALDYDLSLDWSLIVALQQQLEWARRSGREPVVAPVEVLTMIETAPLAAVAPAAVSIPETSLGVAAKP